MARNPLVSTRGVTTANEGVFILLEHRFFLAKKTRRVCCYGHKPVECQVPSISPLCSVRVWVGVHCHTTKWYGRSISQVQTSATILKSTSFVKIDSTLRFHALSSGICWNMLKSCTLYDCIAVYNDLSWCEKKIHHLSRKSCDLVHYFDCFHLDSLHFLQVHLRRKVSWKEASRSLSPDLRLSLALFAVVFVAFWGFLVRKGNLTSRVSQTIAMKEM